MILTCPACQAQYNLGPEMLGANGRTVRCVACNHTWFQQPEGAPPVPQQSLTEALDQILEKDDAAFEEILSGAAKQSAEKPAAPASKPQAPPVAEPPSAQAKVDDSQRLRVKRTEVPVLPIVTHNPFGVNANVFGALVFCMCTFFTLTVAFAAKGPIVNHWPATSFFYKKLGFQVKAPGEGLRLSEMTADEKAGEDKKILAVEAKMTNTTDAEIPYPALHVALKGKDGNEMQVWDLKANADKIKPGDTVPLKLHLTDAAEGGSAVEVRVKN